MSEKENEFLKSLKTTLTIALGSSLVVLTGILLTFYFTTNFKIGEHDKRLDTMEINSVHRIEYDGHIELQDEVDRNIAESLLEIKSDIKNIQSKL